MGLPLSPFSLSLCLVSLLGCSSTIQGRGGDGGAPPGSPATIGNGNGADAAASETFVTTCSAYGDECSCSYSPGGGNGTRCDETAVPSGVCCGDIGWPDRSLSCTCRRYSCKKQNGSSGESCQCATYESGNLDSCTDTVCCAFNGSDSCRCGPSISCNSSETQVTRCEASTAGCIGSSQGRVSSCSTK